MRPYVFAEKVETMLLVDKANVDKGTIQSKQ
jgi:hypothetical protein